MSPNNPQTFFRRPLTRDAADLTAADVAVIGFPFDSATTNRPGTRFGPRGIRQASAYIAPRPSGFIMSYPYDFNVFDRLNVVDWGDVYYEHAYADDFLNKSEAAVKGVLEHGCATLGLGGDHFVTYPILRAHAAQLGHAVALIHFDAHSDTWQSELKSHGTMFYHAAREGIIDAERSVQIGMRTNNADTHGFTVIDARAARKLDPSQIAQRIRDVVGDTPCYVTFDIDCLDPAFAPGTGTPVAGGLTSADALEVLEHLTGYNDDSAQPLRVIGADVVEVAPPYDVSEITSLAAAQIAHSLLHLIYHGRNTGN